MNKIVLKHSRIEINNYDLGDAPQLEYLFSVFDPITHNRFFKGIEYNEEEKRLVLPRGIDIGYIKNLFIEEPYVDKHCDEYVNTTPIPIRYLTKDERQYQILQFILGKDKYIYTLGRSQLAINSSTGSGKTFVTVAAICFSGARAIIITNSIDWLNQWKERIMEYTPLTGKQIYMIAGISSINKILSRDPLDYQIFLVSHATIKSYGDKYGWDRVENLFRYLKCSMKIFDEAHLYFDNMAKIDFHSNTRKTLYLTATPERSDREENIIYQWYFKNIPSISLFDENTDPHVHYVALHFNSHPTPFDIQRCSNRFYGFGRLQYIGYVVHQPNFKKLVTVLIDMILTKPGKCLIYIGTNDAIKVVYQDIITQFPFLQPYIGIYTSITGKEEKESMLYRKIILSTTKSCGAAQDIYDLRMIINLAEPFKSSVLARQTLGRCRLDDTMYIDIVDNGFYYCKNYFKAKQPVFARYAKSCKNVAMDDNELGYRASAVLDKYNTRPRMIMHVYNK